MEPRMQFIEGAKVVTAQGETVGHIDRVVLDPKTKTVTHVVVRKGFLLHSDKVLPIDQVAQADEDQITLDPDATNLADLPDFEEKHYVSVESDARGQSPEFEGEHLASPYYWNPPVGLTQWGYPWFPSGPPVHYVTATQRNIPEGTVALEEGADVITADYKKVGSIERIFTDPKTERATHFLVSEGMIFKDKKLIPTWWVELVSDEAVYLTVPAEALEALPEYDPQP